MPRQPDWTAFAARHPGLKAGQLIERAIEERDAETVLGILQHTDVDVNETCDPDRYDSVSPLVTALRAGDARIAALVAAWPGFDLGRSLPPYEIWSWARTAPLEVLRQYLAIPGADVNRKDANGKTLLHEAVYDLDSVDKVRELLSRPSILIDAKQHDDTTPLHRTVLSGHFGAFELLLARGADVNNRNNDNRWTTLMSAVALGRTAFVARLLQDPRLDVNARDDIENTALHLAAERGDAGIVGLLLAHPGIEINAKDHRGWTALAKAAFGNHVDVIRDLLARPELEVNFVDQDRQTPLFHAATAGNLDAARLLLADPRINPAITNRPTRHTALDIATALRYTAIAQLIRSAAQKADELAPADRYVERTLEPTPSTLIRPPKR